MDAMAGTTSQPSLGAIVGALSGGDRDTGLNMDNVTAVNDYWEEARGTQTCFKIYEYRWSTI